TLFRSCDLKIANLFCRASCAIFYRRTEYKQYYGWFYEYSAARRFWFVLSVHSENLQKIRYGIYTDDFHDRTDSKNFGARRRDNVQPHYNVLRAADPYSGRFVFPVRHGSASRFMMRFQLKILEIIFPIPRCLFVMKSLLLNTQFFYNFKMPTIT